MCGRSENSNWIIIIWEVNHMNVFNIALPLQRHTPRVLHRHSFNFFSKTTKKLSLLTKSDIRVTAMKISLAETISVL